MQKRKGSRERGVTLLEVLVSLTILGGVIMGTMQLADLFTTNSRAAMAAQHMTTIGKAMQAYIKKNHHAVLARAETVPALITVDMLIAEKYLPAGFNKINSYGRTVCGLVLRPPSTERLNALLVTENLFTPTSVVHPINDEDLVQIVGMIGAAGGGVYYTPTPATEITGAMGGWRIPINSYEVLNDQSRRCDGTSPGVVRIAEGALAMALWFVEEKTSNALYRNSVDDHLELNQMNTPIKMNSPQATWSSTGCTESEVGSFTIGPAVGSLSGSSSGNGSPMSGQLLVCQKIPAGVPLVWGESANLNPFYRWAPVASPAFWKFSDLPACGSEAPYGQLATVLSSKEPNMGAGYKAWHGKVYVCGFDSSLSNRNAAAAKVPKWAPVGVDDDGNLMVHGTAGINKLGGILEIVAPGTAGGNCSDDKWEGISSDANGRLARDTGTGDVLVCKDKKWKAVDMNKQRRTMLLVHEIYGGDTSLQCPVGWDPWGSIYKMRDDDGAEGTQSYPTYERACLSAVGTVPTVTTLRRVGSSPACGLGSTKIGEGKIITAVDYVVGVISGNDYYPQSGAGFITYETYCQLTG